MTLKGLFVVVYLDLLVPLAVLLNIYLYFYPVFHFCSFHDAPDGSRAPFRLLALADPQLEGDTTLLRYASQHRADDPLLSYLDPHHLARDFHRIRKTIDLWGNDLYLSHIYHTVRRGTSPTHTVVLGDLLGSQWIGPAEFERRGSRFWNIFSNGTRVNTTDITHGDASGDHWRRKIITLPGNHDIGYAGDVSRERVDRFETMFGPVNYMLSVTAPSGGPSLSLVVLNSMTLDEPITDPTLRSDSHALIQRASEHIAASTKHATVLLTHLPFHKPGGVCVDPPLFTYFPTGGLREQNHLREATSDGLLSEFFGAGKTGVILTGHDHEGCDVRHVHGATGWNVTRWEHAAHGLEAKELAAAEAAKEGVREITVRSMMGGYGGNAGLLSGWWDEKSDSWKFEYSTCAIGSQYVWWGIYVVDIICMAAGIVLFSAHNRDQAKQLEKAAKMQEELERKQR
ncbi:hypothetical protein Q9L58_007979 [Maublancomyces gigas]|uniref:Calcineurin-like phosphoesterase domain-containing protein n=1 Tax=Discina gigas TaxID=1032678 RepID=A0ABR3GB97_9PEZI